MGNITSITDPISGNQTYTYDELGQLKQATIGSSTSNYSYDGFGNRISGTIYTYGNTQWRDLLTAYNGQKIAYEGQSYSSSTNTVSGTPTSGNPIRYYNGADWIFGWTEGRNLTSASKSGTTISYAYDSNGIRLSKTVNGVKHDYVYAGGKLIRESYSGTTMDFIYDSSGCPYALTT